MEKWYVSKVILNVLILMMVAGFLAYISRLSVPIQRLGLVIFLAAGTTVMVRGVVKITVGMRKKGRLPQYSERRK